MTKTPSDSRFHTTQWSLISGAKEVGTRGEHALKELFEIYWAPIYAYARRSGLTSPDAEDAVQGFFLTAFKRELFAKATPERGRLRSLLLTSFKRYLIDISAEQKAQKRHPEGSLPFLDIDAIEERVFESERTDESPKTLFDREWANAILDQALRRLRLRYEKEGHMKLFETLRPHLSHPDLNSSYEALADSLGMKTSAVGVALHRMRKRYREAMRETICETLEAEAEAEDEFKELARILTQTPL
ncbi:MAG: RNA polymerase sigma factor [Opitutales bacterium]